MDSMPIMLVGLYVFILATLAGKEVITKVPPTLHTPLMSGANAISGIAIVVDVQVTLGIILWIFNSGWDQGFFIAVFHPIAMILALGVMHMAIARGRRTAKTDHAAGNRMVAMGMLITLVLVFAAIPWQRM